MMDGLTIMLGVFINLLYTYTLPNNHYSTTYMLLCPHLMAKHCLNIGRKSDWVRFSKSNQLPDNVSPKHEGMHHSFSYMLIFIGYVYKRPMNTIWWHHYSALPPLLTGEQDLRQGACHHYVLWFWKLKI